MEHSFDNTITNNGQTKVRKKLKKNDRFKNTSVVSNRKKVLNSRLSDFLLPAEVRKGFKTITRRTMANKNEQSLPTPSQNLKIKPLKHVRRRRNWISEKLSEKAQPSIRVKENAVLFMESVKQTEDTIHYVLLMPDSYKREVETTTIEFQRLVRMVQQVTLPSAEWKIKLILQYKQVARVCFTNKAKCERCIHFSRSTYNYEVTFGGVKVTLLGAPQILSSLYQLNILLNIVHHIADNDPILEYALQ